MLFQPAKHDVQLTDTEAKQTKSLTLKLFKLSEASENTDEDPRWHGKSCNSSGAAFTAPG
jgi:hypothetical protein